MNFLLFGSVADVVGDVFNIIWSQLNLIIYGLIVVIFRLFTNLSQLDILSADQTNGIYQRVTMVITIVMVFYITFEFVKYVVQPDTISDKEKGVGKIGMRIVIAILLIAFIPTIFNLGMRLQNKILSTNVISKVILGQDSFDFKDAGSNFAGDVFSAFYRVDYSKCGSLEECQKAQNKVDEVIKQFKEDKGALALESAMISSIFDFDDTIQYDGLLAVVFGAFILYVVFLYCIDLGVRYIQLIFLQIIAPIAAISYIVPQKDGMFQKWTKQVTTTYLDVFIRVAILYFMLLIVSILSNSLDFFEMSKNGTQINIFEYLFVIAGLLIFVQRAPKLLEELLPFKGGAASIGFGFSGKSRFEPIGKTIGTMAKPVAATAGLVGGGLRGIFKREKGADGKKHLRLNKKLTQGMEGDGFGKRLKRGLTYATSAVKSAGAGAAAGAKTGRFSAAQLAAQQATQKDESTVNKGGTVLGSTFRGTHYQNVSASIQTQIEDLEAITKAKENVASTIKNIKIMKNFDSYVNDWVERGIGDAAARDKAKKDIEKAARVFAASNRDATAQATFDDVIEKTVKSIYNMPLYGPYSEEQKSKENEVNTIISTLMENKEVDSVKWDTAKVAEEEAARISKGRSIKLDGGRVVKVGDPELTATMFAEKIGDIADQAEYDVAELKSKEETRRAQANASESKK